MNTPITTSSKRILILSPAHPLRGGIAASSERLAQALQEAGHEVCIYSFSLQYPEFLFPGKTQFTNDPPPDGLQIKTRINSVNPLNWWCSGREMAREQPDQIIVRFWLPFLGPCLGSVLRIARFFGPKHLRITGLVDNIIPHEKRFGDRPFAAWFAGACHDFVAMSASVREAIYSFLPARRQNEQVVRFAPHPVYDIYGQAEDRNSARQALQLPENAPVALFFGFIRKYKGLDLLLEALAYAPEVHALVAGECYEQWDEYQSIIDRKGVSERVHLHTDFIPQHEVARYFSAADIVVQPYRSATQSGISQIAYHFEKPMIVTHVGGLPEIVRDGVSGYVVEPQPENIGAALTDFFRNHRADTMTAGVIAEKKRFSWENLVNALLDPSSGV